MATRHKSAQEPRYSVIESDAISALFDPDGFPHHVQAEAVIDAALRLIRIDLAAFDTSSNTAAAAELLSHELHRLRSL